MKALIKVAYRQVIDYSSRGELEQNIFKDTYNEYLLQVQSFDPEGKYKKWHELQTQFPKAIVNVPLKVGFSIGGYINNLNNKMPGVWDSLEAIQLPFKNYKFDILDSDITNRPSHKVSVTYESEHLTLLGIVGEFLIVALGDQVEATKPIQTFLLRIRNNFSILSWDEDYMLMGPRLSISSN